jgi:thiol-disulfide isomerase/thioredoxin
MAGWIWHSRIPFNSTAAKPPAAPQEGFSAPYFLLTSLDEKEISLTDFEGSPLVINFWASWCPPCRSEMPAFQHLYLEYAGKNLRIITINATNQDSLADVESFILKNNLSLPVLLDKSGSASKAFNIYSLPTTFFINSEGIIQKILIGGPIPLALMRIQVEKLLRDSPNVTNN